MLLIAHMNFETLGPKEIHNLDKAIDDMLSERKEMVLSPWMVILLTSKKAADAKRTLEEIDAVAKRSRGWLKKRPLILLYSDSGRVLRFGDTPEHDHIEKVLNILTHP